jgi:predicted NBD/HSP70 family sugar kinase
MKTQLPRLGYYVWHWTNYHRVSSDEDHYGHGGVKTPAGKAASSVHGRHRIEHRLQSPGPAGQQSIRRQNLALVLQEVMKNGPRSRAGIAAAVGLTRSTVSSLVGELIARRLLLERELERAGAVGRPGRLIAVSDTTVVALGLEINVDYLAACVLDLTGNVRYEQFLRHENREIPAETVLDALAELGRRALDSVESEGLMPVGTTIAVPGIVDVASGSLLTAPNLGWGRLSLVAEMGRRLGRPHHYLTVENDAKLAALGELWLGHGLRWGDFIYLFGSIGVGGALVVNGELLRSGSGFGGEPGHITVDRDGPQCHCGARGCLEQLAGLEALLRAAGLEATVGTSIALPDGGASLIVKSARRGDAATLAALAEAGGALGFACAAAVNLLAPNTIVLGGIYAPLFAWLNGPLRGELEKRAFLTRHYEVAVVRSGLGASAPVRGAASLALRAVCADPFLVST